MPPDAAVPCMIFRGSHLVLSESGGLLLVSHPPHLARDPHAGPLLLGHGALDPEAGGGAARGSETRVVVLPPGAPIPDGAVAVPLRQAMGTLDDAELALAGRAFQLLTWRGDHRFCGRCGVETGLAPRGSSLVCSGCGYESFPRVSPAVIVLVHDGDRVLLGRAPRFPEGMYSTLAGFVEPGESAEDTVHREILEESGVEVAGLRYMGSQSWPFPHSLMLGYHAAWAGGEVSCEDEELEDVRWFPVDDLPRLPSRHSIARRLIDTYVQTRIAERTGG